jgi:hypothetical protein
MVERALEQAGARFDSVRRRPASRPLAPWAAPPIPARPLAPWAAPPIPSTAARTLVDDIGRRNPVDDIGRRNPVDDIGRRADDPIMLYDDPGRALAPMAPPPDVVAPTSTGPLARAMTPDLRRI